MTRLEWDQPGERFYETGVDRGVLYRDGDEGVSWNGLVSVDEKNSGGEHEPIFFEGTKIIDIIKAQDFQASLEAYSAPREFAPYEGRKSVGIGLYATNQVRETFGLSYRTILGNDLDGVDHGYEIHLVYNATAMPSSKKRQSIAAQVNPTTMVWEINTTPPRGSDFRPTAHIIINSLETDPDTLSVLEDHLYGTVDSVPYLPSHEYLLELFNLSAQELIDNADPTNLDQEAFDGGDPGDDTLSTIDGGEGIYGYILDGGNEGNEEYDTGELEGNESSYVIDGGVP